MLPSLKVKTAFSDWYFRSAKEAPDFKRMELRKPRKDAMIWIQLKPSQIDHLCCSLTDRRMDEARATHRKQLWSN
jgi:hypothetical protein